MTVPTMIDRNPAVGGAVASILLETGGAILLEDGSEILLEAA